MLSFEKNLLNKGYKNIVGIDEVGRGCLAGPMVVCAVILNPVHLQNLINNDVLLENLTNKNSSPELNEKYHLIKDSKLLTAKKRALLSEFIIKNCLCYAIAEISSNEIDNFGISACTQLGFVKVSESLKIKPDHILTDAFKIKSYAPEIQTSIIKGDRKSVTIAAASIIAKHYRDSLMSALSQKKKYQPYHFEKHKGYGTKLHIQLIKEYGASDIHRLSFAPLSDLTRSQA